MNYYEGINDTIAGRDQHGFIDIRHRSTTTQIVLGLCDNMRQIGVDVIQEAL